MVCQIQDFNFREGRIGELSISRADVNDDLQAVHIQMTISQRIY